MLTSALETATTNSIIISSGQTYGRQILNPAQCDLIWPIFSKLLKVFCSILSVKLVFEPFLANSTEQT